MIFEEHGNLLPESTHSIDAMLSRILVACSVLVAGDVSKLSYATAYKVSSAADHLKVARKTPVFLLLQTTFPHLQVFCVALWAFQHLLLHK